MMKKYNHIFLINLKQFKSILKKQKLTILVI
jgi:hypothetical protein